MGYPYGVSWYDLGYKFIVGRGECFFKENHVLSGGGDRPRKANDTVKSLTNTLGKGEG